MKRKVKSAAEVPAALVAAVAAAREKKAEAVRVLDLRAVTDFSDFFVVMTGTSARQAQALVDAVEERLRTLGLKARHVEGRTQGEWVLLDYIDFVVHVFTPPKREFYDLERLWSDADEVEIPEAAA